MVHLTPAIALAAVLFSVPAAHASGAEAAKPAASAQADAPSAPGQPAASPEAEKARKTFDTLYADDIRKAEASRTTADDADLAVKLFNAAQAAEADPALLTLLCEAACNLGAKDPKGYDAALEAADLLASNVPAKAEALQTTILTVRRRQFEKARGDNKAAAGEVLIDCLISTATDMARSGDFDEAIKTCRQALPVARAVKSPNADGIAAHIRHLADQQKVAGKVPDLKAKLQTDPADRPARAELVRLLVVELDNPEEAAAYVDDPSEADVRRYVPAAAKGVDAAPEAACPMLAEWYLGLSKDASPGGKARMLGRAKAYCERFLAIHPAEGPDRVAAAVALKKVEADLKGLGAAAWTPPVKMIGTRQWVDLLPLVDPEKDAVTSSWRLEDGGLRLRQASSKGIPACQIPVALLGDYEVEVKFVVRGPNYLGLVLPMGDTAGMLEMVLGVGNEMSGWELQCVDGESCRVILSGGSGPRVQRGRPYTLRARVETAAKQLRILASIDGQPVVSWAGERSRLALPATLYSSPFPAVNPKCLNVVDMLAGCEIRRVRLRMLSGRASPLRPPAENPAPAPAKR